MTFSALLAIPTHLHDAPWQLALWHSRGDGEGWAEAVMAPCSDARRPQALQDSTGVPGLCFETTQPIASSANLSFTLKFRQHPGAAWEWIRETQGKPDGLVIFQDAVPEKPNKGLPDLIGSFNFDGLKWASLQSQSPDTSVWLVKAPVEGAQDGPSSFATVRLGVPWGSFLGYEAAQVPSLYNPLISDTSKALETPCCDSRPCLALPSRNAQLDPVVLVSLEPPGKTNSLKCLHGWVTPEPTLLHTSHCSGGD